MVSIRAVLGAGTYWLQLKADSFENKNVNFDKNQNFCETYLLSFSVSNTKSATEPFFRSENEEYCLNAKTMPQKLELNSV